MRMRTPIWILILCITANLVVTDARADQVYTDSEVPLSFRYPDLWHQVAPQLRTTRVLLYADDGTEGTCNVSTTDRSELSALTTNELRELNAANHTRDSLEAILLKAFPDLKIVSYWRGYLGQEDAGFIEFEHELKLQNEIIPLHSILATTFSKEFKITVTCNAPVPEFPLIRPAFDYIVATLLFAH